jgi:hypothetical protein
MTVLRSILLFALAALRLAGVAVIMYAPRTG